MSATEITDAEMTTEVTKKVHRHGSWAWLLAVPPALAVIGSMITLFLVLHYPDHEVPVEHVTQVPSENGVHQHVVNSVTPPLK